MVKKLSVVIGFAVAITGYASAQERIAVLDTDIPKGIDAKVVIPITEKIMEEFVRSKLFIVLDRSFIAKTLSEQEFSASDLTTGDSAKLATIGGFLKATYIVVSTVQKLDTRYFLSAKMIEVKSGVIVAQTSVDRDGSVSVLIDMAGELGRKLVASAMGQDTVAAALGKSSGKSAPERSTAPAQTTAPESDAAKPPKEPREAKPAKSRFSTITGDVGSGIVGIYAGVSYGLSTLFPFGLFYLSAGASIINTTNTAFSADYGYVTTIEFVDFDGYLGLGIDFPIGPVLLYAGPRASFTAITGYEFDDYGDELYSGLYSGAGFGYEVGADIKLGGFAIGLRYSAMAGTLMSDYDDSEAPFDNSALMLRAGFAF